MANDNKIPSPPSNVKLPDPKNSIIHEDVARVVNYDYGVNVWTNPKDTDVTCYDDTAESS